MVLRTTRYTIPGPDKLSWDKPMLKGELTSAYFARGGNPNQKTETWAQLLFPCIRCQAVSIGEWNFLAKAAHRTECSGTPNPRGRGLYNCDLRLSIHLSVCLSVCLGHLYLRHAFYIRWPWKVIVVWWLSVNRKVSGLNLPRSSALLTSVSQSVKIQLEALNLIGPMYWLRFR